MNLSRPAAVAKAQTPAVDGPMLATAEELDRLSAVWLETLRASGYVNPEADAITEEKLLRMLRRINLSADDAEVWMGMLRQIIWKLNH